MTDPTFKRPSNRSHTYSLDWQDVTVSIAGCTGDIAGEVADVLALQARAESEIATADIAVGEPNPDYEVTYHNSVGRCQNRQELIIHIATVAAASFLDKKTSVNVLHAAGFIIDGSAMLISGPPYAGKSNLTFQAWSRGYQILGDDWILYNPNLAEVFPIPKPLKPRVTAEQLPGLIDLCKSHPHYFGQFRNESRLMIGRSKGFYNTWAKPVRVGHFVFIDRSLDSVSRVKRIEVKEALPMILEQTMLNPQSVSLQGIKFANSILGAAVPVYKMNIGAEGFAQNFDLLMNACGQSA